MNATNAEMHEAGEWLAHTLDITECAGAGDLPPPCGDIGCRSLRRTTDGQALITGCRCSPVVLAIEHARAIVSLTTAHGWTRAMQDLEVTR